MVLQSIPTAIVTVISLTITNPSPASAEVRQLVSSLTATGRRHACPGEPMIFTCEVHGSFIQWTFNSDYRTTFFSDHHVHTVSTVSGQHGMRAILTGNDAHPIIASLRNPVAESRRLTSVLLIDSAPDGYSHNISCSSRLETQTQKFQVAEVPTMPLNVTTEVNTQLPVQQSMHTSRKSTSYTLSVRWDAPDNIERFDLQSYKIRVLSSESETVHLLTGTSMETDYQFDLEFLQLSSVLNVTVTAVSHCQSQQSPRSLPVVWEKYVVSEPDEVTSTNNNIQQKQLAITLNNGLKEAVPSKVSLLACGLALLTLFPREFV